MTLDPPPPPPPPPRCSLGGERLGESVAVSGNCLASPEFPQEPQEVANTPKISSYRLGKEVGSSRTNAAKATK